MTSAVRAAAIVLGVGGVVLGVAKPAAVAFFGASEIGRAAPGGLERIVTRHGTTLTMSAVLLVLGVAGVALTAKGGPRQRAIAGLLFLSAAITSVAAEKSSSGFGFLILVSGEAGWLAPLFQWLATALLGVLFSDDGWAPGALLLLAAVLTFASLIRRPRMAGA